jgi:hypothetical protein
MYVPPPRKSVGKSVIFRGVHVRVRVPAYSRSRSLLIREYHLRFLRVVNVDNVHCMKSPHVESDSLPDEILHRIVIPLSDEFRFTGADSPVERIPVLPVSHKKQCILYSQPVRSFNCPGVEPFRMVRIIHRYGPEFIRRCCRSIFPVACVVKSPQF